MENEKKYKNIDNLYKNIKPEELMNEYLEDNSKLVDLNSLKLMVDRSYNANLLHKLDKYKKSKLSFIYEGEVYYKYKEKSEIEIINDLMKKVSNDATIDDLIKMLEFVLSNDYFKQAMNYQNIFNLYDQLCHSMKYFDNRISMSYYFEFKQVHDMVQELSGSYDDGFDELEIGIQDTKVISKHKTRITNACMFYFDLLCESWEKFLSAAPNKCFEYLYTIQFDRCKVDRCKDVNLSIVYSAFNSLNKIINKKFERIEKNDNGARKL